MTRESCVFGLLLVCLTSFVHAIEGRKPFQLYDFSKGLDSYHDPAMIPEGFVQSSLNVLFDDKTPVTKRQGYTVSWSTKAYNYTGLWTYTDSTNTSWQIARSSDQITASNLAGNIVKIATVSVNNVVGEANAFGNAYFVDQTQGVYYWNGTTTTFVAGSPLGSIITEFHQRLWVTGAAVPNGNQLYGSKYYDGTTWTTGLNATDPVQYSIGLQDNFDNNTAEYVYLDTLYIFKHYSIFALYGFDQTSFQISQLTQECGCIDGGSIQTFNQGLKFMSLRGVEDFNGYACRRISDPIKDKTDPAIQVGGFSQASWVQQNTADWNAGTFTPSNNLSTAVSPPALTVSTFGVTETVLIGSVTFNSQNVNNNSFESGQSTNWSVSGGQWQNASSDGGLTPFDGSFFEKVFGNNNLTMNAIDCVTSSVVVTTSPVLSGAWVNYSVPGTGLAGRCLKIQFTCGSGVLTSDGFISDGNDIQFYGASAFHTPPAINDCDVDFVTNSPKASSETYTSSVYNTSFGTSTLLLQATSSLQNSPSFKLISAPTNTGPWTTILTSSGTNTPGNQYVQYSTTYSLVAADYPLTSLSVNSIVAASSGAFQSQIHNITSINSFGNFSVSDSLGLGNIAFSICSSTNSNMGPPESCAVQVPNSQITIATGTYIQLYATFTVTSATQTPTLNSGTVQWFTGSKPTPMSSTVWDNRYWLSLTTNTADTANDAVIVLDKKEAWADYDIHAGAFTQYKNSLYHADSNATGNIYLDNQGYADNGKPINAFMRTKTESLGDFAANDFLYVLYPAAANTGSCAMTVQYNLDKSSMTYSLGSPLLSEFSNLTSVRLPFPIDTSHQVFGQAVDFTLGTDDAVCPFLLSGMEGLYLIRRVQ